MKKLMDQILKFGAVGFFCFFIDFAIYTVLLAIIDWHYDYVIATFWGFTISVIVNYLLSMKFVFVRKDDMDRKKEFVIFVVLSIIGCILNEALHFKNGSLSNLVSTPILLLFLRYLPAPPPLTSSS